MENRTAITTTQNTLGVGEQIFRSSLTAFCVRNWRQPMTIKNRSQIHSQNKRIYENFYIQVINQIILN